MGPLVVQEQELGTLEQERQRILGRLQQPQPPALKSVVAVPQGTYTAPFSHPFQHTHPPARKSVVAVPKGMYTAPFGHLCQQKQPAAFKIELAAFEMCLLPLSVISPC